MVSFLILSLLWFHSVADNLKRNPSIFSSENISHDYTIFNNSKLLPNYSPNLLSLKPQSELICSGNDQSLIIDNQNFQNSAKIANEGGCTSISVSHCTFTDITIPETSLSNGQMSIIYIKSINFIITESSFNKCSSISKISRTSSSKNSYYLSLADISISDYIICHAIYLDENINHEVKISNCEFLDNGISNEADGTLIYSTKVDNLQIDSTKFISNTISSRAIETYQTKNIELNSNTFTKMKGPKGQNGGAFLVQYSNNVTINDCTFDSNTLQPTDETASNPDVYGSAFFINLNDILTFTNNIITNHEKFLNSVIIFNKNDKLNTLSIDSQPIKRKVSIYDTKFIKNSYSQTSDGNGIGFYIEDLSETDGENIYLLSIEFSDCLFENNGNSDCSASVFEWSRKTTIISFSNCNFDSNTAKTGSYIFDIKNGASFYAEFLEIGKINGCGFLHFSPSTGQNSEISITSCLFEKIDSIGSDFIMTETVSDSVYNCSLIVNKCSFSNLAFSSNGICLIKSNSRNLQVSDCQFVYDSGSSGNNAILSSFVDAVIEIIDCDFTNCLSAININELAEKTTIKNCNFLDCLNSPVIFGRSKNYFAENCDISFTLTNGNRYGMQIEQSLNAEIINSNFKNTGNSAIRSFYDLESSSIKVSSCTIKGCQSGNFAFHTKNKIVNFVNNSILNDNSANGCYGFVIESISQINIEKCIFANCYNSQSYGERGGALTFLAPNQKEGLESYMISNCEFIGCGYRNSIAYIRARNEVPHFIDNIISDSYCQYSILIIINQASESTQDKTCLFRNVSFIDINNVANGGGGIGLWFQPSNNPPTSYYLSFYDCRFENTQWTGTNNVKYGGGAISIESASCRNFHISILYCSFYNNSVKSYHGGAIAVISDKSILISDCYIQNCSVLDSSTSNGGGIYVNQNGEKYDFNLFNVTINGSISDSLITGLYYTSKNGGKYTMMGCSFINCNKVSADQSSIVQVNHNNLEFECSETNFIFNESTNTNSRAIDVHCPVFRFDTCYFCRCGRSDLQFGGGINYNDQKNANYDETIEISICTFEKCVSNNCGAFRFTIYNGLPTLYNNTFIDIESNYILALMFSENVQFSHIVLEKQRFIRCVNLQSDGGGCGVWVNNHRADGNVYPTYIIFNECDFIENRAENCNGGAYGVGNSLSVRPTQLNFDYCNFIGNVCYGNEGGGAIWIRTSISSFISSCVFKNNRAGNDSKVSNGGAIYIRFTSSVPHFYLSDSEFVNNSCVNPSSNGHVIYGISLFSALTIDNCDFIDNGIEENPNSVIYTNSYLRIYDTSILYTNKSESFSRAIYVGSSSELRIIDSDFINCTDLSGKAGSIFYEVALNRDSQYVDISYCEFDSNTEGSKSCEMLFNIIDPPEIYGCTFKNENTTSDLVIYNFLESIDEMIPFYYYELNGPHFINCHLNKNFFFNFVDLNGDHLEFEEFSMVGWEITSCTNFNLARNRFTDLTFTRGTFIDNENENILFPFSVDGFVRIESCLFDKNRIKVTDDSKKNETGVISILKARQSFISDTNFKNEEIQEGGFLLKVNSNLDMHEVTIVNCSQNSRAILMVTEEEGSHFTMIDCIVDESGSISFQNKIDQITINESTLSNSVNGFIYNVESNKDSQFSDMFQLTCTTFDNFTSCALYALIFNEISILNNTIKNCHKLNDNDSPIFEIGLKSNTTDYICFEKFTFENNMFNNDNNRLMNGGGTGLFVTFYGNDEKVVSIDFIDCFFISNNAAQFGGAFSFIEGTGGIIISNTTVYASFSFENCTFSKNSCNKLRGHALFIEASNVSIENCIFESHSLLNGDGNSNTAEEISQSSVVFIKPSENEPVSIQNCSFLNNKASSLYIVECDDEISINDCLFESNNLMPLNSTILAQNSSLISSSVITIVRAKNVITVDNCTFFNNSENRIGDANNNGLVRSSAIFASTEKSFKMTNTNFWDNNVNDLILNAYLDVSINKCQFAELENSSSIIGGALIINTKKKVEIFDCVFSGYSSSLLKIEGQLNPQVMTPISIVSDDDVQITNITVGEVSGDVFSITSNSSITVNNCVFDSNSTVIENSEVNDNNGLENFFMKFSCEKVISIDSVSISNYEKALSFNRNTESLSFTNSQITNCQKGVVSINQRSNNSPLPEGTSLKIENVTFSQLKSAIFVNALYDHISLEKVEFSQCSNTQGGELSEDPIVGVVVNAGSSVSEIVFDEVKFEKNEFSRNSEKSEAGGGSGISITSDGSLLKKFASVEFNDCEFLSNFASGTSNSGGALHFTSADESLTFESVSFSDCLFSENEAKSESGALHFSPFNCSSLTIANCSFTSNTAGKNTDSLHITSSYSTSLTASENEATGNVGALTISPSNFLTVTVTSCTFTANRCSMSTGAVSVSVSSSSRSSTVSIFECLFVLNEAGSNIGAFSATSNSAKLTISGCTFVNNTSLNGEIENRVDSLFVTTFSEATIENSNFSKAALIDGETGLQASFVNGADGKMTVNECLFSIVNPSGPQIMFASKSGSPNTTVTKCSFTHFFAYPKAKNGENGDNNNDNDDDSSSTSNLTGRTKLLKMAIERANLSLPFYHILCADSSTQATFVDCCFDTSKPFAISPLEGQSGSDQTSLVSFVNTRFESSKEVCVFPEIVNDLIFAISGPKNDDSKERERERNRRRALIIGLSTGAAALVVIVVVVVVIVVVYKKKHKEMKKTMEYDDEDQQKLEQEEFDFINNKYNPNEEIVPVNINKVENLDSSGKECEETDLEVMDL